MGHWRFEDTTARAGNLTQPIFSFPTWFFDYDNDGWQDLFVSGYSLPRGVADVAADYLGLTNGASKPKLYHNNGNGTFTDTTIPMRLDRVCHTMGCNYGDLDNDGWLDFYCATGDPDFTTLIPNRMFRNDLGRAFQDVTTSTRTGHIQKGHGVAFADFDDDGDQDIYVSMGGAFTGDVARNCLFMNPGTTNRWLKLKLVGVKANRAAMGAKIHVTVRTPAGERSLHRVVGSGASFGANPLKQEIGLGDATAIVSVRIWWPGSDTKQTVGGLELDHGYVIREGEATAKEIPSHPVRLTHPQVTQAAVPR